MRPLFEYLSTKLDTSEVKKINDVDNYVIFVPYGALYEILAEKYSKYALFSDHKRLDIWIVDIDNAKKFMSTYYEENKETSNLTAFKIPEEYDNLDKFKDDYRNDNKYCGTSRSPLYKYCKEIPLKQLL